MKLKFDIYHLVLSIILVFAFFVRFYKLGSYPALNADEAAIGYNAYSLLETGMDEHGNSWPVHFQSFNDFKPGLYVYLVMPFVKFMGLNELAVRFPNALLGVATVFLVYLLVLELFGDDKWRPKNAKSLFINCKSFAIVTSFMLAVSPWHIHFSRGGWEVNTSTFLTTLGVCLFLRSLRNLSVFTAGFSLLAFALSLYTYHSARIVTPLIGLGLVVIYRKEFINIITLKKALLYTLLLVVLLIPLVKDFMGPAGLSRAAGVGLFADPGPLTRINEQRGEHSNVASVTAKLPHNKAINYSLAFLENWARHFHGEFLFVSGEEIQRNKVPETGQMYLFDFVFIILGVVVLFKVLTINNRPLIFVFYWLLIAPFAASLTFQSPHALRSQNMVVPLVLIAASGFTYIWEWFYNHKLGLTKVGNLLLIFIVSWQFIRYQHMYYVHMSKEYPFSSQYGVKELVEYLRINNENYKKIIVTDSYDQPYIQFLFYLKYPPQVFQKEHILTGRDNYGFSTVRNFDKYEFTTFEFDSMRDTNPNSLIVGTPKEIPDYANIVERIYGSNGYEYFEIVAN